MDSSVPKHFMRPLVPLKDLPSVNPVPGPIPVRPASLPSTAPFGPEFVRKTGREWHVETFVYPAAHPRSLVGATAVKGKPESPAAASSSTATGAPAKLSKAEIAQNVKNLMDARIQAMRESEKHDFEQETNPNPLWIAVNRYYPASSSARSSSSLGLTLVVAHANGFSKETWEPTFASLLERAAKGALSEPIDEIWSLDMVNQGDSAVLNKGLLGKNFDWSDNGRDILQFVLSYLPDYQKQPSTQAAPGERTAPLWSTEDSSVSHWTDSEKASQKAATTAAASASAGVSNASPPQYDRKVVGYITEDASLASTARPAGRPSVASTSDRTFMPKVLKKQPLPADFQDALRLDKSQSSAMANLRSPLSKRTWRNRRVALLGHSVGAAGMIYTSSTFPQLFEHAILVDPTVYPHYVNKFDGTAGLTTGATIRRESWKDKEEAYTLFAKNKGFYGKWDRDSLAGFVHFGLIPSRDGKVVELKVDRRQEAYVYADAENYGSKRAFHRLALIPSSTPVHIVRGDVGLSVIPEDVYPAFIDIAKHATHARITESGHLVAQEKPKELAEELARYFTAGGKKDKIRARL